AEGARNERIDAFRRRTAGEDRLAGWVKHRAILELGITGGTRQPEFVEEPDGLAIALLVQRVADDGVRAASRLAIQFAITGGERQPLRGFPRQPATIEVLVREDMVDMAPLV